MERLFIYFALGVVVSLIHAESAAGKYQVYHQAPTVVERGATVDLVFETPGINPNDVEDAFLFYRADGKVAYRQSRLKLNNSAFMGKLDVPSGNASSLEYYMQIQFRDGSTQTYPADGAPENPIRIEVVENRQDRKSDSEIDYTILSPQPGEEVLPGDVVVAITLFYEEGVVDTAVSGFRLFLDGEDITEQSDASDYLLTFVPEVLSRGEHTVSLRLEGEDISQEIVTWSFAVGENTPESAMVPVEGMAAWTPEGQMELMARNQIIGGSTNDALSGDIRLSGQNGDIRYTAYGLLTSQENPRLQPQNRYGAELYVGDWLELQAGHIYPSLSTLTISGQRVQGINAALHPFNHALNLQFIYGKLRRQVSNLYSPIQVQQHTFNDVPVDTSYVLNVEEGGFGSFRRDIIGGRLGFGRGQNFQLGLNLLKVQDDTSSLGIISSYSDLINKRPEMARELTDESRSKLESNPGLLSVNGNPVPKDNLVAGSDLMINLDDDNIQLRADGAVSMLNENINGGVLTRERAEDLGFEIDPGTENLLDQLAWLIIINENMNSLPLRFNVEGEGTVAEAFFPTGILATQSELSFNYFNNSLRLQYRWVGPDFNSLANTTVRRDIAGYTISDRFRLFGNRVYVTLGYENMNDNVISNKDATTNTVTLRSNVSWYPIKQELPRISVGLMSRNRANGVDLFNPYITPSLQLMAVQNYERQDGLTTEAPNARMANTINFTSSISQQFRLFGLTHDASLNLSLLNTTDDFFAYGDAKSNSVSFNLTNRFRDLPLDTKIGFNVNSTKTGSGLTDISIVGFNAGGSMYLMDDKLNVDAAIAFTKNKMASTPLVINNNDTPSDRSDDFYEPDELSSGRSNSHSYIFSAGARYNIDQNHAFVVDMRFSNVVDPLSEVPLPNDRILQARYIFNF